jgi:4-hydroxybenzoate polyprenyltransferase
VAATVAVMGIIAAAGAPPWSRLFIAGLAMLIVQFWIGVVNDICDRDLDASTKPWKPLVGGHVRLRTAVGLAVALPLMAGALIVPLGTEPTALLAAVALAGLSYDVWLKRTRWSWLPYVAFFPLIPLYACSVLDRLAPALVLLLPFGALLGVGVHLANAVQDLEGDTEHRAGGLATGLGRTGSLVASWILLGGAQVVGLTTGSWLGFGKAPLLAGVGLSTALLAGAILIGAVRTEPAALRVHFVMVAFAATALGIGWLAGASWR